MNRRILKHFSTLIFVILCQFLSPSPLFAQDSFSIPGFEKTENTISPSSLPTKDAINQELDKLKNSSVTSLSQKELVDQRTLYLEQQRAILDEILPLNNQNDEQLSLIAQFTSGKLTEVPEDFSAYESLRDERILLLEQEKRILEKSQNIRGQLLGAKNKLEEKEKSLRLYKQDSKSVNPNQISLKALELESIQSLIDLRRLELERTKLENELTANKIKLITLKLGRASNKVDLSDKELKKQIQLLEEKEQILKNAQDKDRNELERIEKNLAYEQNKDQERQDQTKLDSLQRERSLYQTKVRIYSEQLQRLSEAKNIWDARFKIFRSFFDKAQLRNWNEEAELRINNLTLEKKLNESELEESKKNISRIEDKLDEPETNNNQELKAEKKRLETLITIYDENIKSIESHIRRNKKLAYECEEQLSLKSWDDIIASLGLAASTIWNYEIFTSNDYPVTLSKLLMGLLLLVLGYLSSKFISKKISGKLLQRFKLTQGATAAIQTLTFYTFFLFFALIALKIINVPLTVFTVLGGALAIGVGFGSQNIVNNFISGLILLTEQPIRVGDLIEVDTFAGSVRKIGARSTVIRTGSNIDIIVPNSAFLEKNVVNWTRNNTNVRLKVTVGISYGSPTKEFSELLLKAASEHEKIHVSPKPFVWFMNFGDNSLEFQLQFWASVRNVTDRFHIESDLRYRIDQLCRDAGITIAFPQRDVHLDTLRPLEIKMVND